MLGRVRPSPSSLECLESERPSSKIIKDDALSIYETTIMKLKQGSRRYLSSLPEELKNTDRSSIPPCRESMEIDAASPSSCISYGCQSMGTLKEQRICNVSLLYLFSRYKGPRHPEEAKVTIENSTSSASISSSPRQCQLVKNAT